MLNRFGLGSFLLLSLVAACSSGDDDGNAVADAADNATAIDASSQNSPDARITPDAAGLDLPDARPSALVCSGDPLPTTVANPPVTISGTVQEGGINGINTMTNSAQVSAHLAGDDTIIDEGDFVGPFTITDSTNSTTPVDAYLKATSGGFVDTYVFPPSAIAEDLAGTPIVMVSTTIFGLLPLLTGITQEDGNASLIIATVDCEQAAMEGATVSITPNVGTLRYAGANGIPGMTDFPATQAPGLGYIFNVPPGNYQVDATAPDGTILRSVNVKAFADSTTTAVVAP
tara:strand:- start:27249 stop:28109 length:861 start_codon:yes stop_codon:yes gene_type:complete